MGIRGIQTSSEKRNVKFRHAPNKYTWESNISRVNKGGPLRGGSVAVLVCVLVSVNTGRMKEWTKEERRLEEEHRRALSEREGEQGE